MSALDQFERLNVDIATRNGSQPANAWCLKGLAIADFQADRSFCYTITHMVTGRGFRSVGCVFSTPEEAAEVCLEIAPLFDWTKTPEGKTRKELGRKIRAIVDRRRGLCAA